uniref:Uncharacterized protein n=1 Tax=Physcomitrium patens TaxID=3218 RepID=A0A2K1KVD5_PHYPA|nr:hypothetical protein PHYPA_004746 [Physcomitrium patens]
MSHMGCTIHPLWGPSRNSSDLHLHLLAMANSEQRLDRTVVCTASTSGSAEAITLTFIAPSSIPELLQQRGNVL